MNIAVLKVSAFGQTLFLLSPALEQKYSQSNNFFFLQIFSDVLPLICGLTENEATSYGRFLDIILTQCNKWHASKQLYEAVSSFLSLSFMNSYSMKNYNYV